MVENIKIGQVNDDLPRELRVFALLCAFHRIPEHPTVARPCGCIFGSDDKAAHDACASAVIMGMEFGGGDDF